MKKTTLFTTLALVVIVAIALSTATFAWYSASSTATSTPFDIKAESASAELKITDEQHNTSSKPVMNGILPNGTTDVTKISRILNYDGTKMGTNVIENTVSGEFKVTNISASTAAKFKVTAAVAEKSGNTNKIGTLANVILLIKDKNGTEYTITQANQKADVAGADYDGKTKKEKTQLEASVKEFNLDAGADITLEYRIYRNGDVITQVDAADEGTITLTVTVVTDDQT